jgi:hypothetical protein
MNEQWQPQDVSVAIHNVFFQCLKQFSLFALTSAALKKRNYLLANLQEEKNNYF